MCVFTNPVFLQSTPLGMFVPVMQQNKQILPKQFILKKTDCQAPPKNGSLARVEFFSNLRFKKIICPEQKHMNPSFESQL